MKISTYTAKVSDRWSGVKLSGSSNESDLIRARAEAIATGAEVPMCPKGNILIKRKPRQCEAYVRVFQGPLTPRTQGRLDLALRVAHALQ